MGNVANIFAPFYKTTERGNGEPCNNKIKKNKKEREQEGEREGDGIDKAESEYYRVLNEVTNR